jgi:hypothetical protein
MRESGSGISHVLDTGYRRNFRPRGRIPGHVFLMPWKVRE